MLETNEAVLQPFRLMGGKVQVKSLALKKNDIIAYDNLIVGSYLDPSFNETHFGFGRSQSVELSLPLKNIV